MSGYGTSSCPGSGGAQGKPRELLAPSLIPASLSARRRRKKRRVSETAQVAWPGLGSRDLISNSALEAKSQVSPFGPTASPRGEGGPQEPHGMRYGIGGAGAAQEWTASLRVPHVCSAKNSNQEIRITRCCRGLFSTSKPVNC